MNERCEGTIIQLRMIMGSFYTIICNPPDYTPIWIVYQLQDAARTQIVDRLYSTMDRISIARCRSYIDWKIGWKTQIVYIDWSRTQNDYGEFSIIVILLIILQDGSYIDCTQTVYRLHANRISNTSRSYIDCKQIIYQLQDADRILIASRLYINCKTQIVYWLESRRITIGNKTRDEMVCVILLIILQGISIESQIHYCKTVKRWQLSIEGYRLERRARNELRMIMGSYYLKMEPTTVIQARTEDKRYRKTIE